MRRFIVKLRSLQTARKTRLVLLPPKPNEFDTATRTSCGLASLATRHRSTSGSSRLIVGGMAWCRKAVRQAERLECAGGGEQMTRQAFGRRHGDAIGVCAQHEAEDRGLGGVSDRRARRVGVDVIDLVAIHSRVGEGLRMAAAAGAGSGLGMTWWWASLLEPQPATSA